MELLLNGVDKDAKQRQTQVEVPRSSVHSLFNFEGRLSRSFTNADLNTQSKEVTLNMTNFDIVLVGQSHTIVCSRSSTKNKSEVLDDGEVLSERSSQSRAFPHNAKAKVRSDKKCKENQHLAHTETELDRFADIPTTLPLITRKGYLNGEQCEQVMKKLEYLQDNGSFEKHQRLVTCCLQLCAERENVDMELALKIEQGVAFSYHKEIKKSKDLFAHVIKFGNCSGLKNPNILISRAYFSLVANYRSLKVKKISKMFEFLKRSEFYLQNHNSPEDWAELYYNYGSVWLAYLGVMSEAERNAPARRDAREKARSYYEKAIAVCKTDTRIRVQTKKQTYYHLKIAALLLDCSSTTARCQQKRIPPQDIDEAKQHLDLVEKEVGTSLPLGTQLQLLKTRSDQLYRQEIYQLAEERANQALKIAIKYGFKTEVDALQQRIDFFGQTL